MEVLEQLVDERSTTADVCAILSRRLDSFQWAVSEMSVDDNGLEIARALIQGTAAIAVSDGSFKGCQGTSAFIIEGSFKQGRLVGANAIPGEPSSQSPCRSELGGVAGILECPYCICAYHTILPMTRLKWDRMSMKEAFRHWPLDPSRPDYDLLQHIRGIIVASPLTFLSRWIESH